MIFENISANPITIAGVYTIPANGQLSVPYTAIEDDRKVIGYIDDQQLRIVNAEESFTFGSIPRFTQGQLFTAQTVPSGNIALIPVVSGTTQPIVLWVAPFQNVRLYLNVSSGDATLTIQDSPDGSTTFYPVTNPDGTPFGPFSASASDTNGGKNSMLLPHGLCLIQCVLTSTNGGTAAVSYARQT